MFLNQKGYYQGLFFLMLMMIVSCVNDVLAKFMGQRLDTLEILFFRMFFGLITLIPAVFLKGSKVFKTRMPWFNIIRGILGATSFFLYTYSIINLKIVEVVTIMWTIPLFSLILSILFLKESVSAFRWIATLVGFTGLSFITLYDVNVSISFKLLYMAPIVASFLFAVQDVMIKKIVDDEDRLTMLLYFATVTSILTFVPALFVWQTPSSFELVMLFLLGIGGNLIQYFMFKAFSATDLSALSPYRYVEFLFSAFFGYIFFYEIPGLNVLIGAAILIPSTLYLAYTENKRKRRKLTETT